MLNNYAFKAIAPILLIGQLQLKFHLMCQLPEQNDKYYTSVKTNIYHFENNYYIFPLRG